MISKYLWIFKKLLFNISTQKIKKDPSITNLENICDDITKNLEREEYKRTMLTKWNNMLLQNIVTQSFRKDIESYLHISVEELRTIQLSLKKSLQDDSFLKNKLMTAFQSYPFCLIGCSIPATSSFALINNLRQSIRNYLTVNKSQEQS